MVISSTGGTYSAGGVRTTTQRLIDQRGALVATSNPTDLAVRGRGMLPVASAAEGRGRKWFAPDVSDDDGFLQDR